MSYSAKFGISKSDSMRLYAGLKFAHPDAENLINIIIIINNVLI